MLCLLDSPHADEKTGRMCVTHASLLKNNIKRKTVCIKICFSRTVISLQGHYLCVPRGAWQPCTLVFNWMRVYVCVREWIGWTILIRFPFPKWDCIFYFLQKVNKKKKSFKGIISHVMSKRHQNVFFFFVLFLIIAQQRFYVSERNLKLKT